MAGRQIAVDNPLTQTSYALAINGFARNDNLQAVIIWRIVAARDGDTCPTGPPVGGKVHHGSRNHADVDHIEPSRPDALGKGRTQFDARHAAIASHYDVALSQYF